MAEQPQPWVDRTMQVAPQDPWAELPSAAAASASPIVPSPFTTGRARVNAATPKTESYTVSTGADWSGQHEPQPRRPLGWHLQQLRLGGEWSSAAVLFAFVCWGIWAISSDGQLTTPLLVFVVSLLVAVGLFALTRFLGRLILEKQLGRVRRTARGAHIVAAAFMVGVGFAHLRQTQWVMDAWHWVAGLFS